MASKLIDEFVRDVTKAGSIPKSEVRSRLSHIIEESQEYPPLEVLEEGIRKMKELDEIEDAFKKPLAMLNPDSFNFLALSKCATDYLWFLKELFRDESDWISYFLYDCEQGKRPMEITFKSGKKMKLKTVRQLYYLLTSKEY